MRIDFLGTGGYHPNDRRQTACLMMPEIGLVFDAGTAAYRIGRRMQTDRLKIVLTHAHWDHIIGLTYLLVPVFNGQIKQLEVWGTAATLKAIQTHLFANETFPVMPEIEFHQLDEVDGFDVEQGRLTWFPLVSHPGGSMAYRLDWGGSEGQSIRSFAYVTDTTVDGTYTAFLNGVDVLVHECFFPDGNEALAEQTGHSTVTTVARLARDLSVKQLILTHVDPQKTGDDPVGLDAARAIFPNTELAEDLSSLDLVKGGPLCLPEA